MKNKMRQKPAKPAPVAQNTGTAMVYVAESAAISGYGDCFDLLYTFDLTAAREALDDAFFHYTASERRGSKLYIEGWEIPVDAGEDAEEAYRRWEDDKCDFPDPDFYEDYANDR